MSAGQKERPAPAQTVDFNAFFREHVQYVARIVRRILGDVPEVDDVVQIVFLAIFLHRSELGRLDNPTGWIAEIARNRALDLVKTRARRRKREVSIDDDPVVAESTVDDEERVERERQVARLETAIEGELSDNDRELLRRILATSAVKAAAALGRPAGSVRRDKGRIVAFLRSVLKRRGNGSDS